MKTIEHSILWRSRGGDRVHHPAKQKQGPGSLPYRKTQQQTRPAARYRQR
jgi:hypothetical protein